MKSSSCIRERICTEGEAVGRDDRRRQVRLRLWNVSVIGTAIVTPVVIHRLVEDPAAVGRDLHGTVAMDATPVISMTTS